MKAGDREGKPGRLKRPVRRRPRIGRDRPERLTEAAERMPAPCPCPRLPPPLVTLPDRALPALRRVPRRLPRPRRLRPFLPSQGKPWMRRGERSSRAGNPLPDRALPALRRVPRRLPRPLRPAWERGPRRPRGPHGPGPRRLTTPPGPTGGARWWRRSVTWRGRRAGRLPRVAPRTRSFPGRPWRREPARGGKAPRPVLRSAGGGLPPRPYGKDDKPRAG